MEWKVFRHNVNRNAIETFNIFDHGGIWRDLQKLAKCRNKETFADKLKSSVRYYLWSKCEWEVLIYPWTAKEDVRPIKIDAFDQIMNAWDGFVDYCWKHRKEVLVDGET